jgi:transglutaminase-like putative cysteine protease
MNLRISHVSSYVYSDSVLPGLHYLHFYPQVRSYLKLLDFSIEVRPKPDALTARMDVENNLYHQCWFTLPTDKIDIHSEIRVEVSEFNPFNFLVDTHGPQGTTDYVQQSRSFLQPYLKELTINQEMKAFASRKSNEAPLDFIVRLTEAVASEWDHQQRMEQNILAPDVCFANRSGSCRDLARMFMAFLRISGIPARFVSGYNFAGDMDEGHELHAWVETYLGGAGWIGTDPSLGLLTTANYIPVATSFDPQRTMPVQGFYHGEASSKLETSVEIVEYQP